jgi:hypothetical protein
MTTTNGTSQGRITEHVDGVVATANARGVKLVGEDDYRNFSKWVAEPIGPPRRGARVHLGLDAAGFVRELQVLDEPAGAGQLSADRDRTITRLAVLTAAATFLGLMGQAREEGKSEHVLVLADRWLAWVEQPDD